MVSSVSSNAAPGTIRNSGTRHLQYYVRPSRAVKILWRGGTVLGFGRPGGFICPLIRILYTAQKRSCPASAGGKSAKGVAFLPLMMP